MISTEASVELSVILQVGGQRERSAACLASLLNQSALDRMEILVIEYGLERHPPLPGSDNAAVRIIERTSYEPFSKSRELAVRAAKAPVIAFIEDHVIAFDGWAQGIIDAHRQGWKAIGAEVHSGNPGVGISDAIAIMNYFRWLPPASEGEYELLAGHNTAYDRRILFELGEPVDVLLRCDPILQWLMQDKGHRLYLDPKIKIAHINQTEASSILVGYFHWNRIFAPTRAEVFDWSIFRKATWVILAPLIPPVRLAKQFLHFLQRYPDFLGEFIRSVPVQVVAHFAAAAGQAVGLVFGVGQAETDFLRYELNQTRRVNGKTRQS